jgi:hypothetical protein
VNSQKSEITLKPVRGKEQDLLQLGIVEGAILVATDTGSMYMDANGKRVSIGGSGSPFIYAEASGLEPNEQGNFVIPFDALESEDVLPQVDGLIINSDGTFYRILEVDTTEQTMLCMVIAVSGGSGGGGGNTGLAKAMSIKGQALPTNTLVNGQEMTTSITVKSATDSEGEDMDETLDVNWVIKTYSDNVTYAQGTFKVKSGEPYEFEFGTRLRENTQSIMTFQAVGLSSGTSKFIQYAVTTVDLQLLSHTSFNNTSIYGSSFTMYCNVTGAIEKILDYYIDGDLVGTKTLQRTIAGAQSLTVSGISHGYHTVRIELYQSIDGVRGVGVDPLEFEIAVDAGGTDPIIWLGDYKSKYYSYDSIKVPFSVYNPIQNTSTVRFFKGIAELENSPRTVANKTYNQILEITNATIDATSIYYIRVDGSEVYRELSIEVVTDPNRDMSIVYPESLVINFDAAGRSNDESATRREIWEFSPDENTTYKGKFENFNWYNNGWILDENKDACLRISNGAQFSIPIGASDINTGTVGKQSITFEFQFKVRNVQDYSNLIKEITRYASDGPYWEAFLAQQDNPDGYKNYDQFLMWYASENGLDYDKITENFASVFKQISLNATFCQYFDKTNKIGLCLGPQDGFFATGQNTVSVKYVENKMTNMSVVFNYADKKIYIYLNGVLTGVSNISGNSKITINSPEIVFNSEYCDLDLYKFRVYKTALSVADIDINYSVDHKDVLIYDHTTQLAQFNTDLGEYQLKYDAMITFNEDNPNDLLMPYLVLETGVGDMLPYSKANKKTIKMEFVNTGLDRAYATGELDSLAAEAGYIDEPGGMTAVQQYYYRHCPSWKGENIELAVQGTSSEFYPRRNYKAKTKDSDDNINMHMHKGPFASMYAADPESTRLDFFYMNNDTVGTERFTLKIDYMESSGTYNMGFANLVHNAYSKHPLNDYNKAGAFAKQIDTYTLSTSSAPEDKVKYFEDAKGKKEVDFSDGTTVYSPGKYYRLDTTFEDYEFEHLEDYRTNVQGFPVLTFWKDSNGNYTFIGRYNMLLDKGSNDVYGFKPSKSIVAKFLKNKQVRKKAECWEFSNNNRGYCSFRDPGNRDELDFLVPDKDGNIILNSKGSCPVVADSFEYRYNTDDDLLDYLYDPTANSDLYNDLVADYGEDYGDITDKQVRAEIIKDKYENWEKAVAWVWSTCTDMVPSLGTYDAIELFETLYEKGTYFVYDGNEYAVANDEFDSTVTYYSFSTQDGYVSIKLTDNEDLVYVPKVYYIVQGNNYVLCEGSTFDPSATYYKLTEDENSTAKVLETPVTYNGVTYYKDTKEYRLAKFKNELSDHFDLEYCLVYWVMTEVFLCYDSRGKNAMFASWGPLKQGGDYIWYPIFYDIDTQLGINNTGIPSYDYSVNATIEGCYSTSDSVLWNNLYSCYFENIKGTYHTLKNNVKNINRPTPHSGPISSVDYIEAWYLANPELCGNQINMRGARPLIALNMDEFYKYISICNPKIRYQGRENNGALITDTGTFFYALQGDRSLSRQQFLARRINFIDSWLSEGDYSRSAGSSIRGRIAANNPAKNSDTWIEGNATNGVAVTPNSPYYVLDENGQPVLDERGYPKKTNYLDADTYVAMTPYQKSYVTLGDDNEAFASQPYEGEAVKFDFPETLENGIRTSGNYPEQLLYLYGAASLADVGDISKLYWTEFYANGASHLSRLLIGNDHPDFYNKGLKMPNFDAGTENLGKPLLKEVNLTNVTIDNDNSSINFDFTSSEKLQIFKAVGSNVENIDFAPGVALHTLHLPASLASLKLVEANALTEVLDAPPVSTYDPNTDVWTADQGLYIAELTDAGDLSQASSNLVSLILNGGKLGYHSYKLLHNLYTIKKRTQENLKLELTKVHWSPYIQLDEGYAYSAAEASKYYVDDGHYGFTPYKNYQKDKWDIAILNGEIYKLDDTVPEATVKMVDLQLLEDLYGYDNFVNPDDFNNAIPRITGDIYIDNTDGDEIDEGFVRNTLLYYYPDVNFHFAKVKKAYSARFILMEDDGTYQVIGTQKISQSDITKKPWFDNPYDIYVAEKPNYDFHGWSTTVNNSGVILDDNWENQTMDLDQFDYTFYAVFTRHEFSITFLSGTDDSNWREIEVKKIAFGDPLVVPSALPSIDESELDDEMRYKFLGYTQNKHNVIASSEAKADLRKIENMLATQDYTFYAVFVEESVYNSATPDMYFDFANTGIVDEYDDTFTVTEGLAISVKPGVKLSGKITLPTYHDGKPVITTSQEGFVDQTGITHIFFYPEKGKEIKFRRFGAMSFSGCNGLKHCELPESLRTISQNTFTRCRALVMQYVGNNVVYIGQNAFNQSLAAPVGQSAINFTIGGSVRVLDTKAFSNNSVKIKKFIIGGPDDPSLLSTVGEPAIVQNSGSAVESLEIYCSQDRMDYFSKLTATTGRDGANFQLADTSALSIVTV